MKVVEAYIRFILLFVVLKARGIQYYAKYFDTPPFSPVPETNAATIQSVKRGVDTAVRFMVFDSHCVYRSLVSTMMLRRRGIPAVVCLGVSSFPFRAHAWVEVDGTVISGDDVKVSGLYPLKKEHIHE